MNYFRIDRKPKKAILIVLLEAIFTIIFVYIALAILDEGLIAVLISQIIARTLVSFIYSKYSYIYIRVKNFSKKLLLKVFAYAWPFILSSIFSWVIISIDKFIGAKALTDKSQVALLALAMQLVLPIAVLSDMIRMALGPYIMSIRKDNDANQSYQQIFDLVVFASTFVLIGIVMITPFLTLILADYTYIEVIYVLPLIAFSKILSIASNQFGVSFNLEKKNIYILMGVMLAGITGVLINLLFMGEYGYIVSGYSQIASYLIMAVFLYLIGRKKAKLSIKLNKSIIIFSIAILFLFVINSISYQVENQNYYLFFVICLIFLVATLTIYIKQQGLNLGNIIKSLLKKNH